MHEIVVADLHGNLKLYELLLRVADSWRIASIFIAGDLAPRGGFRTIEGDETGDLVALQAEFFRRELFPLLESFFLTHQHTHVYAIFGNDDCRANEEMVRRFDEATPNFHLLNDRCVMLQDSRDMHTFFPDEVPLLSVVGYPYVPPGAGLLLDWVKHENRMAIQPLGEDPCADLLERGVWTTDRRPQSTIHEDLADLPGVVEAEAEYVPERAIHLFHSPPYDTPLDWVPPRGQHEFLRLPDHVGSVEVRRFIERTQPHLVLCGHCHESVVLGSYQATLGNTPCVNPGSQEHIDVLSLVQFDVYQPSRMRQLFINAD